MNIPLSSNNDDTEVHAVLKQTSMGARIHQTIYTLESRVIQLETGEVRSEYRVLLEREVIKNWTEGDIAQYFGLGIY